MSRVSEHKPEVTPQAARPTHERPTTLPQARKQAFKRALLGPAIPTAHLIHERLGKVTALAIFSSDALSSVAYATEEMLKTAFLAGFGAMAFALIMPLSFAIVGVLAILIFSYRQTIKAYPSAGGAYIVTKDNFGLLPAQVAGVALLTDYVLTVAVSVSAGVAAIIAAVPSLSTLRVPLAVGFIGLIALGNLRGVKESGRIFAAPTYVFIMSVFALLVIGYLKLVSGGLHPAAAVVAAAQAHNTAGLLAGVPLLVALHAMASGSTAMTGVEAISNGVPAFKPVEWKNAQKTLTAMGVILGTMFLGISFLAHRLQVVPDLSANPKTTVLADIGHAVFGPGAAGHVMFYVLQVATMLILVLAANTAFADFPRLANFHADDNFLPRQFTTRGHRLVFSNGIIALSVAAAALVVLFKADVTKLIPFYAIGVFTSFSLSQAGMAKRHLRLREPKWKLGLLINGAGALATAVVLVIIGYTKFAQGAWAVMVLVPVHGVPAGAHEPPVRRRAGAAAGTSPDLPGDLRRNGAEASDRPAHRGGRGCPHDPRAAVREDPAHGHHRRAPGAGPDADAAAGGGLESGGAAGDPAAHPAWLGRRRRAPGGLRRIVAVRPRRDRAGAGLL